jgi:hypothetical protein
MQKYNQDLVDDLKQQASPSEDGLKVGRSRHYVVIVALGNQAAQLVSRQARSLPIWPRPIRWMP